MAAMSSWVLAAMLTMALCRLGPVESFPESMDHGRHSGAAESAMAASYLFSNKCGNGISCDAEGDTLEMTRRILQYQHHYYISYGALSADRVPCAPMSGRSYYTPNCIQATGPPDCYSRRCSTITRCARDDS